MATLLVASLESHQGRTAVAAGLGALLAERGRTVRLVRLRSDQGADPEAEDDAIALALAPGCTSPGRAVTEQEALAAAQQAAQPNGICLIEARAGAPGELVERLQAKVLLVSAAPDDQRLGNLVAAHKQLGEASLGAVLVRLTPRTAEHARLTAVERDLPCASVLPEDALLAGPTVREMAEALAASRLVDDGDENEAVEHVMLGPISADPGQPYFLQHGSKAVINRFDKMDLHLAALATEPECLILTGGQQPSPYLLDRVRGGSDIDATVLLAPEGTVATMETLDELYTRTRFAGQRKLARIIELLREHADLGELTKAIG